MNDTAIKPTINFLHPKERLYSSSTTVARHSATSKSNSMVVNNLIYYEPKPLFERFRPPYIKSKFIKSIIKGNISDLEYWVHSPLYSPSKNITCNCAGKLIHYKTF